MSVVSPVLVGRGTETSRLDAAVAQARGQAGSAVFLIGEAGIGKTRLASSVGATHARAGVRVLRGRAGAVALRAISEAVFAALRHETVDRDRLGGLWPVLWRLVSETSEEVTDPPLVRAEAVLQLLAQSGRPNGCILVLEDLHEADADTLNVVDYLVDNVVDQPVLLLGTLRPGPGAAYDMVNAAVARRAATLVRLTALDRHQTEEMAARCLHGEVPADVLDRLHADAEGIPFVIEELLAAMVDDGTLILSGDAWQVAGDLRTRVPVTVTAAVLQRVDRLPDGAAAVLRAAAVIGRGFSVSTAATAAGVAQDAALRYLRLAAQSQLIDPDHGEDADRYAFRHALTAEAILAGLQPAERAQLSRTVAAVLEAAGDQQQLAAELWMAGNRPAQAAALYCHAGRRATNRGALATAAALLDQGLALVGDGQDDDEVTAGLLEEQLRALGMSGHLARVFELGERLDATLSRMDAALARRVTAHLVRARGAAVAGDVQRGVQQVTAARELADREPDGVRRAALTAPIDAVAAHLAFHSPHGDRIHKAQELARSALAAAERAELPEVACEALDVLARCTRGDDLAAAQRYTEQALQVAQRHNLPIWRLQAAMELALIAKDRTNDIGPLLSVREVAVAAGAVINLAWIDFHLAVAHLYRGDLGGADRYLQQAAHAGRQLQRPELELVALGTAAAAAACRADRNAMEGLLSYLPGQDVLGYGGEVWGYLRSVCSLLEEDHDQALADLEDAEAASRAAGHLGGFGHRATRLLLRVTRGLAGWPDHQELECGNLAQMALHRSYLEWSRAVLLGREGRADEAGEAAAEALRLAAELPLNRHLAVRMAAPCAIADGWGSPLRWLRDTEDYFHRAGLVRPAAACRALLRGAGAGSQQRRAGHDSVPVELRRAGVTVREFDVLQLLADRLGNTEIAERLFLSPRTVERHIASLRERTGQPDRAHLISFARRIRDA